MNKRYFIAAYRLLFGGLGTYALYSQYTYNVANIANYQPANFFSFFTVESNILAAIVLLVAGVGALFDKRHEVFAFLRGAATVYMIITGIVYALLLSGLEESLQTAVPWINTVLHYIIPIVMAADWLIDPPRKAIAFKKALLWLSFPAAYVAYSLIRGAIINWYPYPFLNPGNQGYSAVVVVSLGITLAAVVVIAAVVSVTKLRNKNTAA